MMIIQIILCCFLVINCAVADFSDYKQKWLEFKVLKHDTLKPIFNSFIHSALFPQKTYNKQYDSFEDENQRFKTFVDNHKKIFKHNQRHSLGDVTFILKSNQFADLTHKEFVETYIGSELTHELGFVLQRNFPTDVSVLIY